MREMHLLHLKFGFMYAQESSETKKRHTVGMHAKSGSDEGHLEKHLPFTCI